MAYLTSGVELQGPSGNKFVFPSTHIDTVSSSFETGVQQQKMPMGGPMSNIGNNFEGNGKTITVTGMLMPMEETVVPGESIQTIKQQKYWLESCKAVLASREFKSTYEDYSLVSAGGTTVIDGVQISGTWALTKVYVIGLTFDEIQNEIIGEKYPFTLTLWVAGN